MTIEQVYDELIIIRNEFDGFKRIVNGRLNHQVNEIMRLENNLEDAIHTIIHELIEYMRHNDIQSLDEAEFTARLQELLHKEPELPF